MTNKPDQASLPPTSSDLASTTTQATEPEAALDLAPLLEVPCVEGGFLLSKQGEICASCLPRGVEPQVIDEMRAKLPRLHRAFLMASERLDFCTAQLGRYKLCLKAGPLGVLCIFASAGVDLALVRNAATTLMLALSPTALAAH